MVGQLDNGWAVAASATSPACMIYEQLQYHETKGRRSVGEREVVTFGWVFVWVRCDCVHRVGSSEE